MTDAYHNFDTEAGRSHSVESFEVAYWADRFGVSADQVLEVLSEMDSGSLNDSVLERLC